MNNRIIAAARQVIRAGAFVAAGATLAAEPPQLESARMARGQPLVILVDGPAAPAAATLSIERQGERILIPEAKYRPPASANGRGQSPAPFRPRPRSATTPSPLRSTARPASSPHAAPSIPLPTPTCI